MVNFCGFCGAEQASTVPAVMYGSSDTRCQDCGLAITSEVPELAPSDEEMTYELAPWSTADRLALRNVLVERDVPFRWEEDLVLAVHENDVVLVEEILDLLDAQEAEPPAAEGSAASLEDEAAAHAAMDELFLVGDRLVRDPFDEARLARLDDLISLTSGLAPPYGVEPPLWDKVRQAAEEVRAAVDAPEPTPEADAEADAEHPVPDHPVAVAAKALRNLLRPYV